MDSSVTNSTTIGTSNNNNVHNLIVNNNNITTNNIISHSSEQQQQANVARRADNRSLSSSLRRLIAITFSRNSSSSRSKKNRSSNKGTKANGNISSVNISRSNNNSSSLGSSSKKQRDKTNPYKHSSTTASISSTGSGSNNNRPQFVSIGIANAQRSSSTSAQTNLFIRSTSQNNDSNSKKVFIRRSSQPQQVSSEAGPVTAKTSGDAISLDRRQTISDSEKALKGGASTRMPTTWLADREVVEIDSEENYIECPLCVFSVPEASTPLLAGCRHRVCLECMQRYIKTEINHSRLNITCPICSEPIHPNTIKDILQNEKYYLKYESFMLRRVLAAEPDARWCPAPDCGYVVLATGRASCPKLVCGREGCKTSFCYHCKQEWHPNQTCSAASIQRNKRQLINVYNINELFEESAQSSTHRKSSKSSQAASIKADDIKECPVCASQIIKMNDGSCNHMTCSICETEFCWLCMKEISDLHYFSPSGCTFWGKKPWSRKKKLLWQLGMLVGAPICIIMIAGIAVPAIVIGIPVWAARKLHSRLERKPFSRYRKNAIITGGVLLSLVVSPIISAITLAIGIPILLTYVYGVVPLSLCRSSGGCLSAAPSLENLESSLQRGNVSIAKDGISIDTAISHRLGDPSIGETSLYLSNISLETNSIGHLTNVEREDRESASNAALAGSIISNTADDGNSTRALAGSIISKESDYTLVPAEVHNQNVVINNNSQIESMKSPMKKSENKIVTAITNT